MANDDSNKGDNAGSGAWLRPLQHKHTDKRRAKDAHGHTMRANVARRHHDGSALLRFCATDAAGTGQGRGADEGPEGSPVSEVDLLVHPRAQPGSVHKAQRLLALVAQHAVGKEEVVARDHRGSGFFKAEHFTDYFVPVVGHLVGEKHHHRARADDGVRESYRRAGGRDAAGGAGGGVVAKQGDVFERPSRQGDRLTWLFNQSQPLEVPDKLRRRQLLHIALSTRVVCAKGTNPRDATIRKMARSRCWVPREASDGAFLEVNLLREHVVTAVATKGRTPLTAPHPSDAELRRMGYESPEDYPLPRYRVLDDGRQEFVDKYELLFRAAQGHEWRSLGVFAGNTNGFQLVVHSLSDAGPSKLDPGVRCQYLRFRPLSRSEGGASQRWALQVGVFGEPVGGEAGNPLSNSARGNGGPVDGVVVFRVQHPVASDLEMKQWRYRWDDPQHSAKARRARVGKEAAEQHRAFCAGE